MTKQYPTFLENYFKGMETIRELYWESLRAPDDAVNFRRDPYLRENFIKKKYGKTRAERVAKTAELAKWEAEWKVTVDERLKKEKELGIGTPKEHLAQRRENAKARRLLGLIDIEIDENGNAIPAEEGLGVSDKIIEDLAIRRSEYDKQVQEQRARKRIEIPVPVQGISKQEYREQMLRQDEHFKDV